MKEPRQARGTGTTRAGKGCGFATAAWLLLTGAVLGLVGLGGVQDAAAAAPAEVSKLTASDPVNGGGFGGSVSVSGDTAIVGSSQSAAYVFVRSGTAWAQQAKLTVGTGGVTVAISGDTAVVGAPLETSAYVFTRSGGTWSQQAKLTVGGGFFGVPVAISASGDTIAVGDHEDDEKGFNAGAAYVFVLTGGTWVQQAKLFGDGGGGEELTRGSLVFGDGDVLFVGSPHFGGHTGAAYVFQRSGTTWTMQPRLGASDPVARGHFGGSIAVFGDTAVIGGRGEADQSIAGAAYVFVRSGGTWSQQAKLVSIDLSPNDSLGAGVGIGPGGILVGAPQDDHSGLSDAGSAYLFRGSGSTWTEEAKVTASDAANSDQFGASLAMGIDFALIGASVDDHSGFTDAGSAYVFDTTEPPPLVGGEVAVWRFERGDYDASRDASVDAVQGLAARLGNAVGTDGEDPAFTSGKFGGAYAFRSPRCCLDNFGNDWMDVGKVAALQLKGNITGMAWVQPRQDSTPNFYYIFSNAQGFGPGYGLGVQTNLTPAVVFGDGAPCCSGSGGSVYYASQSLSLDTWTHVAFTYDGATVRIYIGGTLDREHPRTRGLLAGNSPFRIGADAAEPSIGPPDSRANADIDEVRIYNRALSAKDIRQASSPDATPPATRATVVGVPGDGGWWRSDVTVTLACADDSSGCRSTSFAIDGGAFAAYTSPFAVTGDGTHAIRFFSEDNAGNVETTQALEVRIDSVAPTTTATTSGTQGSNGWWQSSVTVTLGCSDATSGCAASRYRVDNGPLQTYTSTFQVTGEGAHTVEYFSVDAAGNIEATQTLTTRVSYSFDVSDGGFVQEAPQPASEVLWDPANGRVRVHADRTDPGDELYKRTLPTSFTTNTGFTVTARWSTLEAGSNQTAVPLFLAAAGVTDVLGQASTLTVAYHSRTPDVGPEYVLHYVDASGVPRIDQRIALAANVELHLSIDFDAAAKLLTLRIQSAAGAELLVATYTIGSQPGDGFTLDKVGVAARGVAGTPDAPTEAWVDDIVVTLTTIVQDATAPVTTASVPPPTGLNGWHVGPVTLSFSAADSASGVAATHFRVDGGALQTGTSLNLAADGIHLVEFFSIDIAGNIEATLSLTVRMDATAPLTTPRFPAPDGTNGWHLGTVTVTLDALDPTSGVEVTFCALDGGPVQVCSSLTLEVEGIHLLEFFSRDRAGNTEAGGSVTIRIDLTPPVTTPDVPLPDGLNGWHLGPLTVTLNALDRISGVLNTFFSLNGADFRSGTSLRVCIDLDGITPLDGIHTLVFFSIDIAGRLEAQLTIQIKCDGTPPTTPFVPSRPPDRGEWWRAPPPDISLPCTDDNPIAIPTPQSVSGCAETRYCLDDDPCRVYAGPFPLPPGDGNRRINWSSNDTAGNPEPPVRIILPIDTTPPTVEIVDPEEGFAYLNDLKVPVRPTLNVTVVVDQSVTLNNVTVHVNKTVQVEWRTLLVGTKTVRANATDATSGVERVEFFVDGTLRHTDFDAPYTFSWDVTQEPMGDVLGLRPFDHNLEARAFDRAGNSARDAMVVTTLPNLPPTASGSSSQATTDRLTPVQFQDQSTDLDGRIVAWRWDFGDGAASTEPNPEHTYTKLGTFTPTLMVTDNDGDTDAAKLSPIRVVNLEPAAAFTRPEGEANRVDPVQFQDSSKDRDGTIAAWRWDFGDGATSTEASPQHRYSKLGAYSVTLEVTDNDGDRSTATDFVEVVNLKPEAGFTGHEEDANRVDPVQFQDQSTDRDGSVAAWHWDFGDGATSTEANPEHTYSKTGTYTVTLEVTDNDGGMSTSTRTVRVVNLLPVVDFAVKPKVPTTFLPAKFTDNSTDKDGSIKTWLWDFGDGTTSEEQHPVHVFGKGGWHRVTLTVTDNDGGSAALGRDMFVCAPAGQLDSVLTPGHLRLEFDACVHLNGGDLPLPV